MLKRNATSKLCYLSLTSYKRNKIGKRYLNKCQAPTDMRWEPDSLQN